MSYLCLEPHSGFLWLFRVLPGRLLTLAWKTLHPMKPLSWPIPANPAEQLTCFLPAFLVHTSHHSPLLTYVLLYTLGQPGCGRLTKYWCLGPASWESDFIVWSGAWVYLSFKISIVVWKHQGKGSLFCSHRSPEIHAWVDLSFAFFPWLIPAYSRPIQESLPLGSPLGPPPGRLSLIPPPGCLTTPGLLSPEPAFWLLAYTKPLPH